MRDKQLDGSAAELGCLMIYFIYSEFSEVEIKNPQHREKNVKMGSHLMMMPLNSQLSYEVILAKSTYNHLTMSAKHL